MSNTMAMVTSDINAPTIKGSPTMNTSSSKTQSPTPTTNENIRHYAPSRFHHLNPRDDLEFSKEIARKSVARAALHLGVEKMGSDALDVMGDVLLSYLERLGNVMATTVEKSKRTSVHCNVLDAIHAVEVCTSPAAHQFLMSSSNEDFNPAQASTTATTVTKTALTPMNNGSMINGGMMPSLGNLSQAREWESLACFLFGNDWLSIPLPGEIDGMIHQNGAGMGNAAIGASAATGTMMNHKGGAVVGMGNSNSNGSSSTSGIIGGISTAGGGKQLQLKQTNAAVPPISSGKLSSITSSNLATKTSSSTIIMTTTETLSKTEKKGWSAPYLESVPYFPLKSSQFGLANQHKLPNSISASFHSLVREEEACRGDMVCGTDHFHTLITEKKSAKASSMEATKGKEETLPRSASAIAAESRIESQISGISDKIFLGKQTSFWGSIASNRDESAVKGKDDKETTTGASANLDNNDKDAGKEALSSNSSPKSGDNTKTGNDKKRIRFNDNTSNDSDDKDLVDTKTDTNSTCTKINNKRRKPSYVPSYCPPFPSAQKDKKSSLDSSALISSSMLLSASIKGNDSIVQSLKSKLKSKAFKNRISKPTTLVSANNSEGENDIINQQAVRSSLVSLEKEVGTAFWGTSWNDNTQSDFAMDTTSCPSSKSSNAGSGNNKAMFGQAGLRQTKLKSEPAIVPLGKSSESRISRILEGSMDSYQ
mmetsp:Transcript_15897/g.22649  ORF Transcript_15897/g.22649 Transcript_15897/m.22649 type:complete len:710 (+) Transcript_15897:283-2412(+)|eukprot:CAMPEP_0184866448 /NCGR_PEP_ID=MMETSP0580-20130426/22419_1 /TAXON_ID=1118495 /ORGANISM="Dactyliosolen fragilissimus" /LENGTH=709 /DNA_ID=CAMNT_0027366145 /DNA_START=198 /DNA_END=2327 /DNA_ORIENTATION=-